MAQLDARPTGDQEITGSIPTGSSIILLWRLILKIFYGHSVSSTVKKGSCQFLAKDCAQVLVNRIA